MYNHSMDYAPATVADVVKFMVQNSDHINLERVAQRLATTHILAGAAGWTLEPDTKPSTYIAKVAKQSPDFTLQTLKHHVFVTTSIPQIIKHISDGEIIQAIKLVRSCYDLGLKEAKDLVLRLQLELYLRYRIGTFTICSLPLGPEMRSVFDEIMGHFDEEP